MHANVPNRARSIFERALLRGGPAAPWMTGALCAAFWLFEIIQDTGVIVLLLQEFREDFAKDGDNACVLANNRYFSMNDRWYDLYLDQPVPGPAEAVVLTSVMDLTAAAAAVANQNEE